MNKINMPPELTGLLNLVLLMNLEDKLVFFQDKQMASYWREDMAWDAYHDEMNAKSIHHLL
jgi:hypothetical protein